MRWGAISRIVGHEGKYIICLLSREFTLDDGSMCRLHVSLFQEPSEVCAQVERRLFTNAVSVRRLNTGRLLLTVWESAASRTVKLLLAASNNGRTESNSTWSTFYHGVAD